MTTSPTNPAGDLVMVPRDPSKAMVASALNVDWTNEDEIAVVVNVWHEMVAASPAHATGAAMREIEAAAARLWRADVTPVTPRRVADARTAEAFEKAPNAVRNRWLRLARAALSSPAPEGEDAQGVEPVAWQPIATAPKDGTTIDLWHEDFGRQADCYWGKSQHECGETGRYCDSDWHSEPDTWIDATFNSPLFLDGEFTHWRPLPLAPPSVKQEEASRG
ncbi:hypothetical protein [Aureimonas flava]|uniref:hypothetical protein n=1 Tax=Aureimonas flava TaxID=2320271 RepID=UPI0010A97147|nr:hypothetical protein [Aureimonas flava]